MSFLDYTGKVKKDNNRYFYKMRKGKDSIVSSNLNLVGNPIIDNLFKAIFLKNEFIIKSLLNSIFFTGDEEIKELKYIQNEFPPMSTEKYGKGSKRLDIAIECIIGLKDDKNKENIEHFTELESQNNKKRIIIGVEMQIGFIEKDTERFIGYAASLYSIKNVNQAWVIALTINPKLKKSPNNNKTSKSSFSKKSLPKYKEIKTYDNILVIQIDLNFCYDLLKKNKKIWIFDENKTIKRSGKEWIKYLTIPLWCEPYEKIYYPIPDVFLKGFIKEEPIKEALNKLANINHSEYMNIFEYEEKYQKEVEKNAKLTEEIIELKKRLQEKTDKNKYQKEGAIRENYIQLPGHIENVNYPSQKKYRYPKDDSQSYEDGKEDNDSEDEDEEEKKKDIDYYSYDSEDEEEESEENDDNKMDLEYEN